MTDMTPAQYALYKASPEEIARDLQWLGQKKADAVAALLSPALQADDREKGEAFPPLFYIKHDGTHGEYPQIMGNVSALEVFRIAGGDTECSPNPTPEQALDCLRDLRQCYEESLATQPAQASEKGISDEQEARMDARVYGSGFLVDGKRVDPAAVTIIRGEDVTYVSTHPQPVTPAGGEVVYQRQCTRHDYCKWQEISRELYEAGLRDPEGFEFRILYTHPPVADAALSLDDGMRVLQGFLTELRKTSDYDPSDTSVGIMSDCWHASSDELAAALGSAIAALNQRGGGV